jgi:hypothetical protein
MISLINPLAANKNDFSKMSSGVCMTDKRWRFELDDVKHTVELEHNPFSNKLSIYLDGKLQTLSPKFTQ